MSDGTGSTAATPQRRAGRSGGVPTLIPGIAASAAVAVVATALGRQAPVVGAPVIAIVCGILISLVKRPSTRMKPGLSIVSQKVLQGSIVVLGFGLSFGQVLSASTRSLPVLLGTLAAALGMAWLAGRVLSLPSDLRTLIGVGTAICGASAIAATDAVIDADEADVSYAVATIFTFNVVAVLLYPSLGHLFGFSPRSFGLWAGTAINDLSSVVAASTIYGHGAASYGVIVKLTRTLAIIPITLALAIRRNWHGRESLGATSARRGGLRRVGLGRVDRRRVLPTFILAFVAAVGVNTAGLVPAGWHRSLSDVSIWMITAALAAIGLSTDVTHIRRAGLRPLALGAILWLTVGLTSIGLQAISGPV
ncbi:MAG: putative sulfate exporter family transporter [Actinomycetota bacterium]|nr:putative sulfate exporter family transporter [Actinomycetota bacterium]